MFQSFVENQFQMVTAKLDLISERIEKSEASLEEQMSKSSCIPSSTPKVKGPKKRNRQTPVALQVQY